MLTRRFLLAGTASLIALPARAAAGPLAALEARSGGRLGVAVFDSGSGRRLFYRMYESFPMCSTFKALLAAAVLARIDAGTEKPERVVPYTRAELVTWSPVTEKHAGEGMRVAALIDAVLVESDNTAANLLLGTIGGPKGWTDYARSMNDSDSRLDRLEPDLNSAIPGDERDTTTPACMMVNLNHVLISDGLSNGSRSVLMRGMERSTTGLKRLRAGLPPDWVVGDKTGTGANGTYNDIAIITPPGRKPIVAAVYLTQSKLSADDSNALIADVGRVIAAL